MSTFNWNDYTFELNSKDGRQGSVGFVSNKDGKREFAIKSSKYIDHLPDQEYCIGIGMSEVMDISPHFVRPLGVDRTIDEDKEFVVLEYVPFRLPLCKLNLKMNDENLAISIVLQVLSSIYAAQRMCNFTHYDLHSQNILVKHCNKDLHFLFSFSEEEHILLPSFGYLPKIIDYGFSYCHPTQVKSVPFYSTLEHTHVGFTTTLFDRWNDTKLLLLTVADDFKYNEEPVQLDRIIRNLFEPLHLQWDAGWERFERVDAVTHVKDVCKEHLSRHLKLFRKIHWVDLICHSLDLPFKRHDTSELNIALECVENEFSKIENVTQNVDILEHIFKQIVDSVREMRKTYLAGEYDWVLQEFRSDVIKVLDKHTNFATVDNVDWDILFGGIVLLAQCVESLVSEFLEDYQRKRNGYYDKMKIKSVFECLQMLQANYDIEWNLDDASIVQHIDLTTKTKQDLRIHPIHQKAVNEVATYKRGKVLYDLIKEF